MSPICLADSFDCSAKLGWVYLDENGEGYIHKYMYNVREINSIRVGRSEITSRIHYGKA